MPLSGSLLASDGVDEGEGGDVLEALQRRLCTDAERAGQSSLERFKALVKDYWYIGVPVHLINSAFFFGGFYLLLSEFGPLSSPLVEPHIQLAIGRGCAPYSCSPSASLAATTLGKVERRAGV